MEDKEFKALVKRIEKAKKAIDVKKAIDNILKNDPLGLL
jgi:hypothetical protein